MEVNTNKPAYERHTNHLFWLSISATSYFILMNWLGMARAQFQIIQVIIEMFTIPMLLMAMGCFVFSVIFWVKGEFKIFSRPFYSLLLLTFLFMYFIFAS
jgi:hypothetical protein